MYHVQQNVGVKFTYVGEARTTTGLSSIKILISKITWSGFKRRRNLVSIFAPLSFATLSAQVPN